MYQVPLNQLPNQSVSFNVDGAYWQLKVYQAINSVCADISRNGESIAAGVRCYGGMPLMQYDYMHRPDFGNFVFDSDADWTVFGTSCNLYYLNKTELQQLGQVIGG